MLNKIASFYLFTIMIFSFINLQQLVVSAYDNELNIIKSTTESTFLLFTNRIRHQASSIKHKIHKKKSSNRNRAAVHKTTTTTTTTTLPIDLTSTNIINNSNENEISDDNDLKRHILSQPEHVNVTVKVGDTIILNCAINSSYGVTPGVIWMQGKLGNVLTLDTSRITADNRFEILRQPLHMPNINEIALNNGSNSNKRGVYSSHRLHHHTYRQTNQAEFNYYHLKISNVQIDDENEYACETSMSKQSEEQSNLHALFNLHVTRKF